MVPVTNAPRAQQISTQPTTDLDESAVQLAKSVRDTRLLNQNIEAVISGQITDPAEVLAIAKQAAATNWKFSRIVDQFKIASEDDRIELATIALQNKHAICEHLKNFGITSQSALVNLAKLEAKSDNSLFIKFFPNYGIESPRDRFAIASICAQNVGTAVTFGDYFSVFGITSQNDRYKLAIRYIKTGYPSGAWIQNFELSNKMLSRALLVAANYKCGITQFLEKSHVRDQKTLIEVAKRYAAVDGLNLIIDLDKFGIKSKAAIKEIAIIAAKQDPLVLGPLRFRISSEKDRAEIAEAACAVHAARTISNLGSLGITDQRLLFRILQTAIQHDVQVVEHLENLGLSKQETIQSFFGKIFTDAQKSWETTKDVKQVFKLENILRDLDRKFERVSGAVEHNWEERAPAERLAEVTKWLIKNIPGFDDSLLSFQKEVHSEDSIYAVLAATIATWGTVTPDAEVLRSRQAIRELSGLSAMPNAPFTSPNTTKAIYEGVIDCVRTHGRRIADVVQIDPSAWEQVKELIDLFPVLSARHGLKTCLPGNAPATRQTPVVITADNLKQEYLSATKEVEALFSSVFGLTSSTDVMKLAESWGNLIPFILLYGRFSGTSSWRAELPILSKIAESVLDGTFHSKRYSSPQVQNFSPQQLEGWKQNPQTIQLHRLEAKHQDGGQLLEGIRRDFDILVQHLPQAQAEALASLRAQSSPQFDSLPESLATLRAAIELGDIDGIREVASKVNNLKQGLLTEVDDLFVRKQLSQNLGSINDKTKVRKAAAGKEYVVFSVITDDPKLLLTVGDLVNTGSCQNYRTGSHIQTLPGYVIDGNIKVATSFVIAAGELSPGLRAAISKGTIQQKFNAPKLTLELHDPATGETKAVFLGKALHRNILRAGTDQNKELALLDEPPYFQPHAIEAAIVAQQKELVEVFRKTAGLVAAKGKIDFPASSNPLGVYSDGAERKGPQIGEYSVFRRY